MLGDVIVEIIRSDGQEFVLGDGDWRIPNDGLENWANLNYNVSTAELPAYDGSVVTSKRVATTDRSISAVVGSSTRNAELRKKAIEFFNPKYTYDVYLTYQGRTRHCKGEQIGFKCSEGNMYEKVKISWTILCPNPFLLSVDDFGEDIAESLPMMLGFPYMSFLPPSEGSISGFNRGFIASRKHFSQVVEIKNDGDVPTRMRIVIKAQGEVKNPMVKIDEHFIRALKTMQEGDVLDINLQAMPPKVTYNGENALNILDRKSNVMAMKLDVGETYVEYDADDGYGNMMVSLYFNKQYLGI